MELKSSDTIKRGDEYFDIDNKQWCQVHTTIGMKVSSAQKIFSFFSTVRREGGKTMKPDKVKQYSKKVYVQWDNVACESRKLIASENPRDLDTDYPMIVCIPKDLVRIELVPKETKVK